MVPWNPPGVLWVPISGPAHGMFSKLNGPSPLGSRGHSHTSFRNGRFHERQSSFHIDVKCQEKSEKNRASKSAKKYWPDCLFSLEILDFSHSVVVKEFLVVIRNLYLRNRKTFSLKTLFLPVTSAEILHDVVNAFPNLEDLRLWTSMEQIR